MNLGKTQRRACSKQDYLSIDGEHYPATFTVENLLWTWNFTCRRDPASGDWCAPIFDAWANGNAAKSSCSDCVLGTYQEQLNFPLGYDDDLASSFSLLTSSCSATGYPMTSPGPATIAQNTSATATSTAGQASKSCASTYEIKDGDDCHSISRSQQVSTAQMLYFNNLEAGCTHFPGAGTKLCMPHKCDVYNVNKNDTCYGITSSYNNTFTMSQLVSWNVDINRGCDNLEMLVGNQICVSFPGDASAPSITDSPAKQTTDPVFPCMSAGAMDVDESCYVTTYSTLPPWTWTPVNTSASITGSSSSSGFSWTSRKATSVPSFSTASHTPNPTPTPFMKSMVSDCTNFVMARGKIKMLPDISCKK